MKIDIINDNINDIYLLKDYKSDYNIELFLKKFSNIKKLKLEYYNIPSYSFSMKENKNIIIEELELPNPTGPVYFSFSYLRSLTIDFQSFDTYKDFSLFNSNCTTNFSNLENLNLNISNSEKAFKMKYLQNFANNTKYFKNLKKLNFKFYVEDMEEKIYFYFIQQLLSLNIIQLYVSFDIKGWNAFYKVQFKFYTRTELIKIINNNIKKDSKYIYKIQRIKTNGIKIKKEETITEGEQNEKCLMF